jgi:hypothetical protein
MSSKVRHVREVDRHFEGRLSPAAEAELRAHLPSCARCQRRYERRLLLARLDPRAASAEDRLAAGLGFSPRRRRAPATLRWGALALAAAAVVLFVGTRADEPQPRGGAARPTLLVYRVTSAGAESAGASILEGDELAFAYANPTNRRYLLIYGVDEHGHVYWFHPGWPAGSAPPSAVAAHPGAGPHELPEAVRHRFDGRRLRITAVLTDERLGVGEIERDGHALEAPVPRGAESVSRMFEVAP